MTKITKQLLNDDKILIKIAAESTKELTQAFWRFINYGNCVKIRKGVEIEDLTGLNILDANVTEGYFKTNIPELTKTLIAISLFELLREHPELDEIPAQISQQAQKMGLKKLADMPEEDILGNYGDEIMLTYD